MALLGALLLIASTVLGLTLIIGGCLAAGYGWWKNEKEKLEIKAAKEAKQKSKE